MAWNSLQRYLHLDIDPGICFMSSGLINQEALREQHNTTLSIGRFIRTPVTTEYVIKQIKADYVMIGGGVNLLIGLFQKRI
jgi:hypothetical protein